MAYGDKRDYPKIEIWLKYPGPASTGSRYYGATTWAKTCKEAKAQFIKANPDLAHAAERVTAHFVKG